MTYKVHRKFGRCEGNTRSLRVAVRYVVLSTEIWLRNEPASREWRVG